jgi:hypothetical protein
MRFAALRLSLPLDPPIGPKFLRQSRRVPLTRLCERNLPTWSGKPVVAPCWPNALQRAAWTPTTRRLESWRLFRRLRVTIDFVLGEDCEQSREEWNSAGEEAFRSR